MLEDAKTPCPLLRPGPGKRKLCGAVLDRGAEVVGPHIGGVGSGCSSSLFNKVRNEVLKSEHKGFWREHDGN